jgi:hypothetical protein
MCGIKMRRFGCRRLADRAGAVGWREIAGMMRRDAEKAGAIKMARHKQEAEAGPTLSITKALRIATERFYNGGDAAAEDGYLLKL